MTSTYSAPPGLASRPFSAGETFPGAPGFGGPQAGGSMGALSFPVSNSPSAGGSGINGFAQAVARDNRVVDWGTNGQVAYHMVVTYDKKSEEARHRIQEIGIGMLCFARDMSLRAFDHAEGKHSKPNYGPGTRTDRMVEAFELTSLNNHLRATSIDKNQKTICVSDFYKTATEVKEAFPMLGVVLAEVAPSNDSNYGNRPSTRVINFVVRGRAVTFNLWSGKRPAGTPVWFIIKKVRDEKNRLVWAFVPYPAAGAPAIAMPFLDYHSMRPSPDEMCWEEEGQMCVGDAVYVGSLGHNVGDVALDPNKELWKQGLFKTGNNVMPPTTDVFIRI